MEKMENLPYEDREQNIRRVWDKVAALCAEANASIADFFVSMTGETCERRQRADVPLRRDVNDNRSPKKKMRLGSMESPSIDLGTSRMLSARSTI